MSQTRDFLLEVGTEEIPARMIENGSRDLLGLVCEALHGQGLDGGEATALATPRRLAVLVRGLPERQVDREELALGPSVGVAFDAAGEPTRAALGFAKGQGVEVSALIRVPGPKGEVVAVRKDVKGRMTRDVLAEVAPAVLARLAFPKTMRWASGEGPFARPIHWICAIFGDATVPFTFAGIASGNQTRGHRFLFPDPVRVPHPADYPSLLTDRGVMPDPQDRKSAIRAAMAEAERTTGYRFLPNDALIDEVANLVEFPTLAIGRIDEDFLKLPREVLVTAMGMHQRYFAMEDAQGRLVPRFGVVSNTRVPNMDAVVRGYERVLAARLYDARFFYRNDLDTGLESMGNRLGERLFLKGAGTMGEKATRLARLAGLLADAFQTGAAVRADAQRAALLCKADLMSAMVGEFPELQGVMGAYYAVARDERTEVADAIREHYLPRFAGDDLAPSPAGAVLAVADRIDSVVTCFCAGAIPTGSKDPLALRRQAIGLLKTVIDRRFPGSDLEGLLTRAESCQPQPLTEECREAVLGFMMERFLGILTAEYEVPSDFANAVLAAEGVRFAEPHTITARALDLADFSAGTEGFRDFLANVFKRVDNILKKADTDAPGWREQALERGLLGTAADGVKRDCRSSLREDAEIAVEQVRMAAFDDVVAAGKSGKYAAMLDRLYGFKDPLARFFGSGQDGVPVLVCSDPVLRVARLALLERVLRLFTGFADFSKISTR